jgi:hypothetical protein
MVPCASCPKKIPEDEAFVEWEEDDESRITKPVRIYCMGTGGAYRSDCAKYGPTRRYVRYTSKARPRLDAQVGDSSAPR